MTWYDLHRLICCFLASAWSLSPAVSIRDSSLYKLDQFGGTWLHVPICLHLSTWPSMRSSGFALSLWSINSQEDVGLFCFGQRRALHENLFVEDLRAAMPFGRACFDWSQAVAFGVGKKEYKLWFGWEAECCQLTLSIVNLLCCCTTCFPSRPCVQMAPQLLRLR